MNQTARKAMDTIRELPQSTVMLLLCFGLLAAALLVGDKHLGQIVEQNGQRLEIDRRQTQAIERLSDALDRTEAFEAKRHADSVAVLDKLAKVLEQK